MNPTPKSESQSLIDSIAKHLMATPNAPATLWNKCVGKDITIYLTSFDCYGDAHMFLVVPNNSCDPRLSDAMSECAVVEDCTVNDLFTELEFALKTYNKLSPNASKIDWSNFYTANNLQKIEEQTAYGVPTISEMRQLESISHKFPKKITVTITDDNIFISNGTNIFSVKHSSEYQDMNFISVFEFLATCKENPYDADMIGGYQATITFDWKNYTVKTSKARIVK
jgi:hypothetical protein